MSSTSYLNYLNNYINLILDDSDQFLIERLNQPYLDEIEDHVFVLVVRWHSKQTVDEQSLIYIQNVAYLNHKIALLTHNYNLNRTQMERIEKLLCNSKIIRLITTIIQSILETNIRHKDNFLCYLSRFINVYSLMKTSKHIFEPISKQAIESEYYKQYLTESLRLNIEPIHIFFIGTIGQLASSTHDLTLNELYSQYLKQYYDQQDLSNNMDLHFCTLGILSQLDISFLRNNYSCISLLMSIFIRASSKFTKHNIKIFLLPLLNIFNLLCIESKTIACYLNTDQLINILLHYVTNKKSYHINIYTCLLLGHIISEKQLSKLRISYKLTMKFMHLLYYYKEEIDNILNSLLSLVIHEQIQLIIAQTYQLINLIHLSENYSIIYDIIWKLSFHSDIVQQLIVRHGDFLRKLTSLSTIPAANGILRNIQTNNLPRLPIKDEISFDLMLVSSPKDDLIVQQLEEHLIKNNLRVSRDNNSFCILFCISEESKHDCACHTTIRKALLDCKNIILCIVKTPYRFDDWFHILDIHERQLLNIAELQIDKLLLKIQKDLHYTNHPSTISKLPKIDSAYHENLNATARFSQSIPAPTVTSTSTPITRVSSSVSKNFSTKRIQDWTHNDVLQWCQKNSLTAFSKILTHYDGHNLLALAHVARLNAPHSVMNHLRNDCRKQGLNLSFVEYVRFQAALDELLRLERILVRKQSMSRVASHYIYQRKMVNET